MTVRLRHPKLFNCNFNVVHHRRYLQPYMCPACVEVHTHKTYHLRLDSSGEVEVSDEVYERLAELDGLPLKKTTKPLKPTPQIIGMPNLGQRPTLQRIPAELFIPKSMREEVIRANGGK